MLPIADATSFAGPDLDPRIEGLRIQRIAVAPRQPGTSRAMRLIAAGMRRNVDGRRSHLLNRYFPGLGLEFIARPPSFTVAIAFGLDRDRRKLGGGPKRFRRQHRLRKIKAEELVGTIFVGNRRAA